MLAVNTGERTYVSVGWNLFYNATLDTWEVWIQCATGKNKLIASGNMEDMTIVKQGLDFAMENGHKLVTL